jgi:hypothetical protein
MSVIVTSQRHSRRKASQQMKRIETELSTVLWYADKYQYSITDP